MAHAYRQRRGRLQGGEGSDAACVIAGRRAYTYTLISYTIGEVADYTRRGARGLFLEARRVASSEDMSATQQSDDQEGGVAVPAEEAPSTPRELLAWPLEPGDAAAHLYTDEWYFIINQPNETAGELRATAGGTIAEWAEVDDEAAVFDAVPKRRLRRSVARIGGLDDVLQAVRDGTARPVAVPKQRLVPAMEEFVEAEQRGEWSGAVDYLRGDR